MSVYDPYLGSAIRPNNAQSYLWNYALGGAGLGPTSPTFSVPNPTAPYRGVGGNFVGMDTAPGRVGRDIDLEALQNQVASPYRNVGSDQKTVKHKKDTYVIGKDQEVVGGKIVAKDRPKGGEGMLASIKDWLDPTKDRDKKGGISVKGDDGKWKYQVGDPTTGYGMKVSDMDKAVKKTASDRLLEQAELERAYHQKNQPMYDAMHQRNMEMVNQIGENQMARDLNYLKQAYPLAQAAAWDATQRSLYGDKYSTSAAQRRAAEAAGAEATMYAAVANQANAAANLRGSYRGKNIGFG